MFFKKKNLSAKQEELLINAIQKAELQTSGEIRVHFDNKKITDPITAAQEVFAKLKMHHTELRNGILFYVNLKEKTFSIWGDEGINTKVPPDFWNEIKETAISHFKEDKLIDGLEKCILMCGDQLKTYFPYKDEDKNELPNEISY